MYISIRDETVFLAGYATLAEGLHDLNITGIELWVERDDTVFAIAPEGGRKRLKISDAADLAALGQQAAANGIQIAAFCMPNNFNADDKEFEVGWAVRTVRAALTLGIPAVRIDAVMRGEQEMSLEARQELVATMIRRILDETADSPVQMGIENHGFQGNDPAFLEGLLAKVSSPRLGLTLDSGNFYWRGWPLSRVYEIYAQFASRVVHTHIKNIAYPPEIRETQREMGYEYAKYVSPIHEGDIDHTRYFTALRAVGYDRDLCLEDESLTKYPMEQRRGNLRAAAAFFRGQIEGK